ncbi:MULTISPECIES: D-alanyl-D-alanine carboxypeptidase [unclassified Streptomyces]|uniref:D-alanyl-D-alanine carboxypeptidase n=1 Tax=unclassified Streptomyces TaxID=2593676 RepID=UPI0004C01C8B
MAGESPDRSKQRESSEEPTSGSAGPVPEARTGSSEPRDPRLTVAREEAKRSAGSGGGSRGGVDTATRVLSVRDTEPDASGEEEDEGAAAPGTPSDTSAAAAGEDAAPAAGTNGRLRDAVAAWVATAEERAAANAQLEAEDSAPDGDRKADARDDAGEADGDSGTGPLSGSASVAGSVSQGDEESAAAGPDAESASEGGAPSAPDASEEPAADAGPAAVSGTGTDSGSGADAGTAPESKPGPAAEPDTDATPDAEPGSRATSGSDAQPGPGAKPAALATSGSDAGPGADTRPTSDARPDSGTKPDPQSKPGADARTGSDTKSGPDAKPGSGATPGTDAQPGSGATPTAGTKPAPGTKPTPAQDRDADPDGGSDGDGGSDDAGSDGDDAPQVDQPTAVFKAPRLDKPAVDQPTTMLKLGGAASAAEGDAERTSKFVALRNPDDPANRKPPQAPRAPETPKPRTGVTAARSHVGPDRTTQQPLPPKPPLDLLAELTNTPPPPETPLRTTVRRVKIWTPLVVLLVIVLGVVQSMRPLPAPTLDLTAQDSFTFDGGKPQIPWPASGQAALDVQGIGSFGSSGDQKPVPIASVAKVMTAYLILRDHPLKSGAEGPKIKIDQAAEEQSEAGDESTVHVYAGDSISQREALSAVLIASANNVARLLARWDAGSEKAFVEKMNAAAKDLGMTNTTYTDPSGLNNTTVSTAVDQVKLAKAAMKEPAFREVAAMMSYNDYKGENHPNWNQLVGHNDVVGIKTGTTTSALGNLVFAAKKEIGGETRTIVGAVVRQPDVGGGILAAALDSSDKLIRAAQDTLKSSTILKKGSVVGYVDDGLGGRTPVVATKDVKAVGWGGLTVKLTFDADELPHTAKAGTKVGTLTVGDGGTSGAVKVPVALRDDLVEPGFTDKLTRLG